jgi:hypothetical protein
MPESRAGTDIVPLFLEAAEALRPATPAVIVEYPEHCRVDAAPALLQQILEIAIGASIERSMQRAEIRLELGARPGCSFYVRDNGRGDGAGCEVLEGLLRTYHGRIRREAEPGWGEIVCILLPPGAGHDRH